MSVTLPLTVTVSLGRQRRTDAGARPDHGGSGLDTQEVIKPDEDYDNRPGFDAEFLGVRVPLPKLDNTIAQLAAPVRGGGTELKYYNYSVIMNAKRRMAFVSAVNLDAQAAGAFQARGRRPLVLRSHGSTRSCRSAIRSTPTIPTTEAI